MMNCVACGMELATVGPKCLAGALDAAKPEERLAEFRALADGLHQISAGLVAAARALDRIVASTAPLPSTPPNPG